MGEDPVALEPRVARIEADVANLKDMVTGVDRKVDRLEEKMDDRFEKMEKRVEERFSAPDGKINLLDRLVVVMEQSVNNISENQVRLHGDLRDLRNSLDSKFIWIVTTMIAFGSALLAAIAKGFHWLK